MADRDAPGSVPVTTPARVRRPIAAGTLQGMPVADADALRTAVPTATATLPRRRSPGDGPAIARPIAHGTLSFGDPGRPGTRRSRPRPPRRGGHEPSDTVTAVLSEDVCRYLSVLPLVIHEDVVVVAMADTDDRLARQVVEAAVALRSGRRVKVVPISPAELGPAIARAYGRPSLRAVVADPMPPRERDGPQQRSAVIPDATVLPEFPVLPTRPVRRDVPVVAETAVAPPADALPSREEDQHQAAPSPAWAAGIAPATAPRRLDEPLGQLLVADGLLTAEQLDDVLRHQETSGGRLGDILSHARIVREHDVSRVLARQQGLAFVDLTAVEIDPEVVQLLPQRVALAHRIVAFQRRQDATVVALVDPRDEEVLGLVHQYLGSDVELVLATDTQISLVLQEAYAADHIAVACERLVAGAPENSAFIVFSRGQKRFAAVMTLLVLAGFALAPIGTFVVLNLLACAFYGAFSGYKFWLAYESLDHDEEAHISAEALAAMDDRELPIFTILMPMYREAAIVPKLVRSIERLDYPRTKLDIKLLLEADDQETLDAVRALDLPPHFRVVIVPDALPKTKPKACNYGLLLARGDITVIYDAEDEPDPDQLKKVVLTFRESDPATVCVQCKLNYYNRTQNLLTRWFTTEYSMWFDVFLPGLDAHDSPIPLGGTSNHFATKELLELGAWDPHNVAEDADLGIRLNKAGWRTAVLDSTTYEEANPDLHNWIRQRSRWVKGYMQTWLVHMRHPVALWRSLGTRSFLSFQMTVGGTFFGFLLNPFYWALTSLWLLTEADVIRQLFPSVIYYAAAAGLFVGNFTFTYFNAVGSMRRGHFDLVKYALLSPVYWSFMSIAAWKGAYQLIVAPHYWEKTIHGLSDDRPHDGLPA
jgi:cellulose synthase/poly-beta-1,6-N-acetylglucosamine synthase-like glycosyltransferase